SSPIRPRRALLGGSRSCLLYRRAIPSPELVRLLARTSFPRYPVRVSIEPGEAGFRALVEQIPAVTYVVTDEHPPVALYVSPQVEKILGHRPDEWLRAPGFWMAFLHPEVLDAG